MRTPVVLSCLLLLGTAAPAAQRAQKKLEVPVDTAEGSRAASVCCTPLDLFRGKDPCTFSWTRAAGSERSVTISVQELCAVLKANATVISMDGKWYVSRKAQPGQALYVIDCESEVAHALPPPEPPSGSATAPPAQVQAPAAGAKPEPSEKVQGRLKKLESALSEQKTEVQRLQGEIKQRDAAVRNLEKSLSALRTELLEKLKALEEGQKNSCHRIDDRYQGQAEVTVAVAGSVLRFLEVRPRVSAVPVGLTEAKAGELLGLAQAGTSRKIFPHLYLAVPAAVREVRPFFLQDRLIDLQLYSRLTGGKDAQRVSYQDVARFIDELNSRCAGRARFALPSEEQFVAAAHRLYDPVEEGLRPCEALRQDDPRSPITELLGSSWQLTRSLCQPFGNPPRMTCPDSSYVRKGGAASSTDPLECLPEFRSPAPADVNQQETSFRLTLVQ